MLVAIAAMLVLGRRQPDEAIAEMRVVTKDRSPLTRQDETTRRGVHWFVWMIGAVGLVSSLVALFANTAHTDFEPPSSGCMDGLALGLGGSWDLTPMFAAFGATASIVWLLGCVLVSLVLRRRAPF